MGKYSKIIDKLAPAPPENPAYQERVQKRKDAIRAGQTHTPESLAKLYAEQRRNKAALETAESLVNLELAALEQLLLESNRSDEPGWGLYGATDDMIRLASGAKIVIQREPVGKVVDKEAFRLWCLKEHLEQKMSLPWQTMNSIAKERFIAGAPPPAGVELNAREIVKFSDAKEEGGE